MKNPKIVVTDNTDFYAVKVLFMKEPKLIPMSEISFKWQ